MADTDPNDQTGPAAGIVAAPDPAHRDPRDPLTQHIPPRPVTHDEAMKRLRAMPISSVEAQPLCEYIAQQQARDAAREALERRAEEAERLRARESRLESIIADAGRALEGHYGMREDELVPYLEVVDKGCRRLAVVLDKEPNEGHVAAAERLKARAEEAERERDEALRKLSTLRDDREHKAAARADSLHHAPADSGPVDALAAHELVRLLVSGCYGDVSVDRGERLHGYIDRVERERDAARHSLKGKGSALDVAWAELREIRAVVGADDEEATIDEVQRCLTRLRAKLESQAEDNHEWALMRQDRDEWKAKADRFEGQGWAHQARAEAAEEELARVTADLAEARQEARAARIMLEDGGPPEPSSLAAAGWPWERRRATYIAAGPVRVTMQAADRALRIVDAEYETVQASDEAAVTAAMVAELERLAATCDDGNLCTDGDASKRAGARVCNDCDDGNPYTKEGETP